MWLFFIFSLFALIVALYLTSIYESFKELLKLPVLESKTNIFSKEELSQFDGVRQQSLYLAILGNVFNVTTGYKHYGPGQPYNYFVGRDATRSYITGKFNKDNVRDDVHDFSKEELLSLNYWWKLYHKEYEKIGKVIGIYYDRFGSLTPYAREVRKLIRNAEEAKVEKKMENERFPPCNIEWNPETGSTVWCTNRSGGIRRLWAGKPRMYYQIGSTEHRCVCVSDEDLQIPNIKMYPNCDSESDRCIVNQQ